MSVSPRFENIATNPALESTGPAMLGSETAQGITPMLLQSGGAMPTEPSVIPQVPQPPSNHSELTSSLDALPKEFMDGKKPDTKKLLDLALDINNSVNHAISDRQNYLRRVARNKGLYRNQPDQIVKRKPYKNAASYHFPVVGPKLEQRKASLVSVLTGTEKFYTLQELFQSEEAKKASDFLQWNLDNAGWNAAVNRLGDVGMYANQAILLTDFITSPIGNESSNVMWKYAGLDFKVITPEFFLVHPANTPSLLDAAFAGHEFEKRRAWVKAKQKKGYYLDAEVIEGLQALRMERIERNEMQSDSRASNPDNQNVRLYDALVRWTVLDDNGEGEEKVYRVIGDYANHIIYRIENYTCPYAHYTVFRLKEDLNAFWCPDSPANDAQSIQLMLNAIVNTAYWGLENAASLTVMSTSTNSQDSRKDIIPGQNLATANPDGATQLMSNMSFSQIPEFIQLLMSNSDLATKTSNALTAGQSANGQTTATEENIKLEGFRISGGNDVMMWTPSLLHVAMLSIWLLQENFPELYQTYGDSLHITDVRELRKPYQIFISGQKPKSSPQVQMQALMQILNLSAIVPEIKPLIFEIALKFISQSDIEGKEELINELKKIKELEDQQAALAQMASQLMSQGADLSGVPGVQELIAKQQMKAQSSAAAGEAQVARPAQTTAGTPQ